MLPLRRGLAVAAFVAAIGASSHADAGPAEEAAELAERGRASFDSGDYAGALKRYRAAYTLHDHPTYLFNQARAAAKLGDCKLALDSYRAYVDAPERTEPAAIAYARKEIERLEPECGEPPTVVIGEGDTGKPDASDPDRPDGDGSDSGDKSDRSDKTNDSDKPGARSGKSDVIEVPTDASEPDPRRPFKLATIAGAGVTVALLGYTLYEAGRLGMLGGEGHYQARVREANLRAAPGPIMEPDICSSDQIDAAGYEEVASACDDGSAAATRTDIAAIGSLLTGAATVVFAYYGFIRPIPESSAGVALHPGPGDLGIGATVRF